MIFPGRGSSPCLLHRLAESLPLSHRQRPYRVLFVQNSDMYYSSAKVPSPKEFKWPHFFHKDKSQTIGKHLQYISNCSAAVSPGNILSVFSQQASSVTPTPAIRYSMCFQSEKCVTCSQSLLMLKILWGCLRNY